MAGAPEMGAAMARTPARRPPVSTLARRWSAVAAIVIVGYLYYHPLRTYLAARHELASRRAEVAQLAAQKRELTRRLAATTSLGALAREARELGYVRPGEHLYIVKGIEAWKKRAATLTQGGK
jgi:cell division protein FtsB